MKESKKIHTHKHTQVYIILWIPHCHIILVNAGPCTMLVVLWNERDREQGKKMPIQSITIIMVKYSQTHTTYILHI